MASLLLEFELGMAPELALEMNYQNVEAERWQAAKRTAVNKTEAKSGVSQSEEHHLSNSDEMV